MKVFKKCARIIRKLHFVLCYFLLHHRKTIAKLSSYGLTDIRVYCVRHWYMGLGEEKLVRLFYKTKLDGTWCFVKLVENDSSIAKEIFINKYITERGIEFVPKLLLSDDNLLVIEFIQGMKKFKLPDDEKAFENMCADFKNIHACFKKFDIIHGDISASNVLLDKDNKIVLIDFGVGWVPGSEVFPSNHVIHHGTYYVESDNIRIYDNAFSFLRVLDYYKIPAKFKQMKCYKEIEQLVGAHCKELTIIE